MTPASDAIDTHRVSGRMLHSSEYGAVYAAERPVSLSARVRCVTLCSG